MQTRRYIGVLIATIIVLTLSSNVASAYCDAPDNGLVSHWRLEETAAPYLDDISHFTATVSATAPTSVKGVIQNGISNRAAAGHIETAPNTTLSAMTAYSVSFWVKHDDFGGYEGMFEISDMITVSSSFGGDRVLVNIPSWSTQSGTYFADDVRMGTDRWRHIVVTYDNSQPAGTEPELYFDGVQQTLTAAFNTSGTYSAPASSLVKIGAGEIGSERRMEGELDDVRIYNRILDASEVAELYKATAPGHMRFNTETSAVEYCNGNDWVMAGIGSYSPIAAEFEGSSAYMTGALNNTVADSNKWSASFWFRNDDYAENDWRFILDSPDPGDISIDWHGHSGDRLLFSGQNPSSTTVMSMYSDPVTDDEWHHVLFSVDLSDAGKRHIYIDGVSAIDTVTTYDTSGFFDFTLTDYGIGSYTGARMWDGALADLWVDFGTYIDFSSAAQRAKFVSPTGTPMYLGADGSLPTGASPDIFLTGDVEDWHINKGTAGGFTPTGAAIMYASTNPGSPHGAAPSDGLLVWWKLDEDPALDNAVDASGNGNNGDYVGNAAKYGPAAGVLDRGVNATEVNQNNSMRIQTPVFPVGANDPFTVVGWIKRLGNACGALWSVDPGSHNSGTEIKFVLNNSISDNSSLTGDALSSVFNGTISGIPLNEWTLHTTTFDGSTFRFYENGAEVSNGARTVDVVDANNYFVVGSADGSCGGGAIGVFDDWRLYSRALSQPEIQAIYDAAFCENPAGRIGSIIYNQDNAVMQYCNGRDWSAMGPVGGSGGSGCFSPAGSAGDLMYNNDHEILQFCNGQDWVGMGKQQAPTDGLVGYWTLDEASGTFVDSSGEGNDGGAVGGGIAYRSANGVRGYAAGFDGVDDGIIVVASPELDVGSTTDRVTLSAWVYPRSLTSNARKIISHGDTSTASGYGYRLDASDTYVRFGFYASGGHLYTYNTPLTLDEWTLVTATYDGANVKIYLNGVKVSEQAAVYDIDDRPTYPVRIGTPNSGTDTGRVWDGYLDEVRIYDKALSEQEVKQLYNATK